MAQLLPILIIILAMPIIFRLFSRVFTLSASNSLLSTLTISPLAVSLVLYNTYHFYPNLSGSTYLFWLTLTLVFINLLIRPKIKLINIQSIQINNSTKIILALLFTILFLCTLRIFFWPINWDDQIYYVEQGYTFGRDRSLDRFQHWRFFRNTQLNFQTNPAIRPALPILYSLASLTSNNLSDTVKLSQIISYYYFVIFILIFVYYVSRIDRKKYITQSIVGLFFVFTTYLFVNLTVFGFKELIIICILLLSLIHTERLFSHPQTKDYIYLSILFGLMSFINYSGSLFACMFVIQSFFQIKSTFLKKILSFLIFTTFLIVFSGLEFPYFLSMATNINPQEINLSKIQNIISPFQPIKTTIIPTADTSELNLYHITNTFDIYIKGKLQGYFQYQYYGLIFLLFLLVIFINSKSLIKNFYTRQLILFILFYHIIVFDIFGLNHHEYASVLTVSQKYTVLLVPLISLVISASWNKVDCYLTNINHHRFIIILSILSLIGCSIFIAPELILQQINHFIPILSSHNHYLTLIKLTGISIFVTTAIAGTIQRISKNNYQTPIVLVVIFYVPFLIIFNSNFGIYNTIFKSSATESTKLVNIPGWESLYSTINFINSQNKQNTFLLVNGNISQLGIHLHIPATNFSLLNDAIPNHISLFDINNFIKLNHPNFLIVKPFLFNLTQYELVHLTADYAIYHVTPPN